MVAASHVAPSSVSLINRIFWTHPTCHCGAGREPLCWRQRCLLQSVLSNASHLQQHFHPIRAGWSLSHPTACRDHRSTKWLGLDGTIQIIVFQPSGARGALMAGILSVAVELLSRPVGEARVEVSAWRSSPPHCCCCCCFIAGTSIFWAPFSIFSFLFSLAKHCAVFLTTWDQS